jgi:hypothetical protein
VLAYQVAAGARGSRYTYDLPAMPPLVPCLFVTKRRWVTLFVGFGVACGAACFLIFVEGPPEERCSGGGESCGAITQTDCKETAGCSWAMRCIPKDPCESWEPGKCDSTDPRDECRWHPLAKKCSLVNAPECAAMSEAMCTATRYCAWEQGCIGSLAPCNGRSQFECSVAPFRHCTWWPTPRKWWKVLYGSVR